MIDRNKLITVMEELNLDVRFYSGRGMFGGECVGFTTDNEIYDCVQLALALQSDGFEETDNLQLFQNLATDSMGRSVIVYFPRVKWSEDQQ